MYVDALGSTTTYEKYLSGLFPGIAFTVTPKADSKFKIVGAASIAAKVTRDAWITGWAFEEHESSPQYSFPEERGSGYPSGNWLHCLSELCIANEECMQTRRRKRGCAMRSSQRLDTHPWLGSLGRR